MPLGWQPKWFSILCSVLGEFLNPCPCQKSLPNCRAHFEDFEKAPAAKPGHKKFLKTFGVLGDTLPVAGRMVWDPLGHAWGFFEAPPCQKLFAISFASLGATVGRLREPLRKILARRFSKNFFLRAIVRPYTRIVCSRIPVILIRGAPAPPDPTTPAS